MRVMWVAGKRRSSPHPQTCRSQKRWERAATLGQSHGSPPEKDPGGLPFLSPGYPRRTAHTAEGIGTNERKAGCGKSRTSGLTGGGWKRVKQLIPRQPPTQHVKSPVEREALAQKWVKLSAVKQVRKCCKYILLHFRKQVTP